MTGQTVAVTGHRPSKIDGDYSYTSARWLAIRAWFVRMIAETEPVALVSGLALGVDTVAAHAALDADVPLIGAVPFLGQENRWPSSSQATYRYLVKAASEIVVVSEGGYAAWKMQKRNEWMVDRGDTLWAVWDGTAGGTANCVGYAKRQGRTIETFCP